MSDLKEYDIELENGKIKLTFVYDSKGLDVETSIFLETDYLLDKIANIIPGKIDDVVISLIKKALK
jgi:hypothetical protein